MKSYELSDKSERIMSIIRFACGISPFINGGEDEMDIPSTLNIRWKALAEIRSGNEGPFSRSYDDRYDEELDVFGSHLKRALSQELIAGLSEKFVDYINERCKGGVADAKPVLSCKGPLYPLVFTNKITVTEFWIHLHQFLLDN